ncbi:MAG: hypothetical protein IH941_00865 [Acidobacteria bacterium]|nr:hypothetical protein [Acidobacteriota bacterium]
MSDLTRAELERVFDFLELKRDEKLGCWVCGGNEWTARKIRNDEKEPVGPAISVLYVQLICKNCKQVAWFTDKALEGI